MDKGNRVILDDKSVRALDKDNEMVFSTYRSDRLFHVEVVGVTGQVHD